MTAGRRCSSAASSRPSTPRPAAPNRSSQGAPRGSPRAFPEFDAILCGEAESNWAEFLAATEVDPHWRNRDVPGLVVVRDGVVTSVPTTVPDHLWAVTPEAYETYLHGWQRTPGAPLVLPVESSRGCWWADARRCTFCAVDPLAHPYRSQPGEQVTDTLAALWEKHQPESFTMTDSCMPLRHHSNVLQALRSRPERADWSIYYEVKSTLHRAQVTELADAGVREVQPGIESLHTQTLKDMRKGATMLQQVNLLKWCRVHGIRVIYPILYGVPTETAERVMAMARLVGRLHHLHPPSQLNQLRLYRNCDYWVRRDEFTFADVRPLECDRVGYGLPDSALADLVFNFNYSTDRPDAPAYESALRVLRSAIAEWQEAYGSASLTSVEEAGATVVARVTRHGANLAVFEDPAHTGILGACAEPAPLNRVRRELGVPTPVFDAAVADLVDQGFLLEEGGWALNLTCPLSSNTTPTNSD